MQLDKRFGMKYHSVKLNNIVKKIGTIMDQRLAESLTRQLKIAIEHVVREEYEPVSYTHLTLPTSDLV